MITIFMLKNMNKIEARLFPLLNVILFKSVMNVILFAEKTV